jgi:hypothetical protein
MSFSFNKLTTHNPKVAGSNPGPATKSFKYFRASAGIPAKGVVPVRCREFSPYPAFFKRIRFKYPTRPWSLTTASTRKACLPKIITPLEPCPRPGAGASLVINLPLYHADSKSKRHIRYQGSVRLPLSGIQSVPRSGSGHSLLNWAGFQLIQETGVGNVASISPPPRSPILFECAGRRDSRAFMAH